MGVADILLRYFPIYVGQFSGMGIANPFPCVQREKIKGLFLVQNRRSKRRKLVPMSPLTNTKLSNRIKKTLCFQS